jgi:hypothetical protein
VCRARRTPAPIGRALGTVPFPSDETAFDPSSFQRIKYTDEASSAYTPPPASSVTVHDRQPPTLIRHWTSREVKAYIGTASAVHTYQQEHGTSSLAEDFVRDLGDVIGGDWAGGEQRETVVWPLALLLMRKR